MQRRMNGCTFRQQHTSVQWYDLQLSKLTSEYVFDIHYENTITNQRWFIIREDNIVEKNERMYMYRGMTCNE